MLNLNVNAKYFSFVFQTKPPHPTPTHTHIAEKCVIVHRRGEQRVLWENTKLPTDPVYLDIDQSFAKEETIHTVIKDVDFSRCSPQKSSCTRNGWRRNVGSEQGRSAVWSSSTELYNAPSATSSQCIFLFFVFQWWFTDVSTLGVKICKKNERKCTWVSCIRIPDYRGPGLEAQTTLGHFYSITS